MTVRLKLYKAPFHLGLIFITGFCGILCAENPENYPKWSWDKVPVYLHFGSHTQLTDEQVSKAAAMSSFICLEKSHGFRSDRNHPEQIMAQDARRLKEANPDAKVLFYWNTLIAWPFTSYNKNFADAYPPDWTLRNFSTNKPILKAELGGMPVYQYNLLNPQTRAWWANVAGKSVNELGFDGLYMDAISQARRPTLLNTGWGRDKGVELDLAAIDMMKQVRSKMNKKSLLIFNGLRTHMGHVPQETKGGTSFLPYADGAKIEHFDQLSSATKEDILTYWHMATEAAAKGKIILYKAWPDHGVNFTNQEFMSKKQEEKEAIACSKITFPLVCFLIGAQKYSYFCYGWGYNIADGQLIEYPEYQYSLGAPKANANRVPNSWEFSREFEHASVWVDLEKREARINWNLKDSSVGSSSSPTSSNESDWEKLRQQVLELGKLTTAPPTHPAEGFSRDGVIQPLYFESLPWKGKSTRVFAWLGLPKHSTLAKNGKFPGIVLVHGGGGTAFKDWVMKWNERGFAAISIAVEGQTSLRNPGGDGWVQHDWAGPTRVGIYGDSDQALSDQWMYHAVADTILANSLLRELPQVDPTKVGLMGISWGGVITSTVIGIDDRFAFAIPTYGCGSLSTAMNQYGRVLGQNKLYHEVWDPMVRMSHAQMPVLWMSWPGDLHFPLDAQTRSYQSLSGPYMVSLIPGMRHGHAPGWNPPDSYAFAESVVETGMPWCRQLGVKTEGNTARISFSSTRAIDKATFVYTSDSGITGKRIWKSKLEEIRQNQDRVIVNVNIPEGTTAWFINLHSSKLIATSDFQEVTSE
jgi:dienelactone hydrolase